MESGTRLSITVELEEKVSQVLLYTKEDTQLIGKTVPPKALPLITIPRASPFQRLK
jgi:hypothetical protein